MKYAAEMSSGAMMYVPYFIKIGAGIQNFMGGGVQRHAERMVILYAYFYLLK
jgi:hypothetical protein